MQVEQKNEVKQTNLFYVEHFELLLRTYRNQLVRELNSLQQVYQVETLFGKKITDYESYLNLCTLILDQIKQVSTFIKNYGKLDEPLSEFVLSTKNLPTITPSPSGNEDRKECICQ